MQSSVKKREVFYLHGYDPRGARFYYRLYKEHLLKQNKLNNLSASISSRKSKDGNSSWNIVAHENDIEVHTKYNFLAWNDIISKNWARSIGDILKSYIYTVKTHIFTGLIVKYARISPYIMVNIMYITLYISLLIALVFSVSYLANDFFLVYVPWYLSVLLSIALGYTILKMGIALGHKIAVFWILNINTFMSKWAEEKINNMEDKVDTMSDTILTVLKESDEKSIDEVLLVAHSVGVAVLVPVLASLLKKCKEKDVDISKLKIVTIAGNIPMISYQKNAGFFRDDLRYILEEQQLTWLDYTSKIDGLCFPLLDFSSLVNIDKQKEMGPTLISTRFHKLFKKDFYECNKKRYKWAEIHFWYLMSHDYVGEYDYFRITAGSQPLESFQ
ncbi:MAG: hypothetical protein KJO45_06780 [Sulfurovum sp.]|nr:hypothetical protein [Sulfurovum sp.]